MKPDLEMTMQAVPKIAGSILSAVWFLMNKELLQILKFL